MEAIKYVDVTKAYGDVTVLNNFNLTIEAGEFVTMVGSSGSGKTTLLKMINGLYSMTKGDIFVHGENIKNKDMIQLRRQIGYAIQGSVLFPHMTVENNISYVPRLLNKKDNQRTQAAVDQWMKIVGLSPDLKKRYPRELSGGQRQRVGIARALAASPDILLMDEPFGAVDEITRSELQDELKRIHRENKITVVFVTHDIKEALKLGTKVLVLHQGEIHQYDKPEVVRDNPATEYVATLLGISQSGAS